jgi:hypothetical protein
MNRTIRAGLLAIAIAGLITPAIHAASLPLSSAVIASSFDGTQPMPNPVPIHPPTSYASMMDGTQPMPNPVPIHPPVA